jgi:hypothetical protein
MPLLFLLQTAFSIYLLVHAARRGAPQYWWFIIMMPFGEWAYFFAVYLPSQRGSRAVARPFTSFFERPPSLETLRRAHRHTPCHDNLVRLAQGLYDGGDFAAANQRFSEFLAEDPDDKEALYGYAQSCLALDDSESATKAFEHLLDMQLDYRGHEVAFELARAYWKLDREDDCVALLKRVCRRTERLEPRVALARYLQSLERYSEARETLEAGLDSLAGSPAHVRRRQRQLAWQARQLLRDLPSSDSSSS